jgi:iron-sulfur cluster assembly protein
MAYDISFATDDNVSQYDELLNNDKIGLFIDLKVSLFLFGTEMDFVEKKTKSGIVMESGFVFQNPNETGKCGCGESFYV